MTEAALTISFANLAARDNPYWLRMELVEDETTMSIGEAARLIDELYHTSICGDAVPVTPDQVQEPEAPDWDRILAMVDLPQCNPLLSSEDGDSGAYDVQIKVYRSHQDELYKLVLSNGRASQPRRISERVDQVHVIDGSSSLLLDTPIVDRPVIAWTDIDGPDIHIKGNLLYWDMHVSGTLRAEFDTVYDLIHIHVTGIRNTQQQIITGTEDSRWLGAGWYSGSETGEELTDVQDIECEALAFYHYQYESLVLHKPEVDESISTEEAMPVCQQIGSTFVESDTSTSGRYDEAQCKKDCERWYPNDPERQAACKKRCERECFKRVKYTDICECGGDETTTVDEVPVPCPPGYNTGSIVNESHARGGVRYVNCGDDSDVDKAWFYEQTCCEGWPFGNDAPMPECEVHYGPFVNKGTDTDLTEQLKRTYGDNVNIISVAPKEGRCGDTITTQDVDKKNCCDTAPQLYWDDENSGEVVSPGGEVVVAVTGGVLPLTVKVRGSGFWLDPIYSMRDGTVNGRMFKIYADSSACGSCVLYITDGCSSVNGYVRSTAGHWGWKGRCDQYDCTWAWSNLKTKYIYKQNKKIVLGFWQTMCTCSQVNGEHPCEYGGPYNQSQLDALDGYPIVCSWLENSWSKKCCTPEYGHECKLCPVYITHYEWVC